MQLLIVQCAHLKVVAHYVSLKIQRNFFSVCMAGIFNNNVQCPRISGMKEEAVSMID